MSDRGYSALVNKAISAPDDVSVVEDAEGRLARIERDSAYRGAMCVRLDATESETPWDQ